MCRSNGCLAASLSCRRTLGRGSPPPPPVCPHLPVPTCNVLLQREKQLKTHHLMSALVSGIDEPSFTPLELLPLPHALIHSIPVLKSLCHCHPGRKSTGSSRSSSAPASSTYPGEEERHSSPALLLPSPPVHLRPLILAPPLSNPHSWPRRHRATSWSPSKVPRRCVNVWSGVEQWKA